MKGTSLMRSGLIALFPLLLAVPTLPAQDVTAETFSVPRSIDPVLPSYPFREVVAGEEGLVRVDFMVDREGKAFDPVVADFTGSDKFHAAALEALLASRFEPARREGEPIVGSATILYRFELEGGSTSASERFSGVYRNFQRALRGEDESEIRSALEDLEAAGAQNHYEHAFLNLARYNVATRYGSDLDEMHHLWAALSNSASPSDPLYLDEALARELRRMLLPLQLRNNYFPYALDTYALMEASGDAEAVAFFADTIAKVRALEFDETEYPIVLTLDAAGTTSMRLFKHHVAVTGGMGEVAEARLHCEQQYVAFALERDVSYALPAEWGECSMQIIGDAGASFYLLQLGG